MIILGLTGSIGMGKSTTANMFLDAGIPVYDSDAAVHALYQSDGKAVDKLESAFPGVKNQEGSIDRQKLSAYVLKDSAAMKKLEAIVHPLVFETRIKFLEEHKAQGTDIVVFDIPLLFETGSDAFVDKILVVTAPTEIQKQRVLSREGMTEEKFSAILAKQMPDEQKRERADFIIDTSLGLDNAEKNVHQIIQSLIQLNENEE